MYKIIPTPRIFDKPGSYGIGNGRRPDFLFTVWSTAKIRNGQDSNSILAGYQNRFARVDPIITLNGIKNTKSRNIVRDDLAAQGHLPARIYNALPPTTGPVDQNTHFVISSHNGPVGVRISGLDNVVVNQPAYSQEEGQEGPAYSASAGENGGEDEEEIRSKNGGKTDINLRESSMGRGLAAQGVSRPRAHVRFFPSQHPGYGERDMHADDARNGATYIVTVEQWGRYIQAARDARRQEDKAWESISVGAAY
ncbi:hypothetical protein MKZ38_008880 [Zalerion maritima]|uniref:Uncharacterized protein n=1 Tax=Zalerion maritima TaxID=339359 RepID=A0AAD5RVJ1_9PEZI|nr:hypothetical protein MKZ38_008880 [Zalerion maritima]